MVHLAADLVAYLRGDSDARERARIEAHLAECAPCRDILAAFSTLLADLATARPAMPEIDWGRWQAGLERKLDARLGRRAMPRPASRTWRALPLALSGALAGVLVYLALHGAGDDARTADLAREPRLRDLASVEETMVGQRLDLLRQYPFVEKLELLEDLDVIGNLDRLADAKEGRVPALPAES